MGTSWYSLSTSTSSVGFTGTPLRARQRPPAFWAFLSVERMRVGWSGSMVRRALPVRRCSALMLREFP